MSRHAIQMMLRRFVLACYLGAVGAAIASPILFPQQTSVVCSAGERAKIVVQSDDGVQEVSGGLLDCPLCLASTAPPPHQVVTVSHVAPPAHMAVASVLPGPALADAAAPPPPRGPPQVC